ncbi:MAG TPA: DUF443 family protein [Pseudogracilibacillus sp.]|nr:DUF443 family protein [Pseudogracilibacillus sp.]
MKTKVRNLVKNPRYRLLHIDDEHYIIDMGGPLWKTLFPYFFWVFPNTVYKIEDQEIVKLLKAPLSVKEGGTATYAGIGVIITNLFGSAVHYFEISIPLWLNVALLLIAITSVLFLYQALNHKYQKKLHHIVHVDSLPKYKLQIRPQSFVHICKISYVYIFCIGISVLSYMLYVSIQNIFVLFGGSVFFFILLIGSRMTAAEGTTKVIFKENHD